MKFQHFLVFPCYFFVLSGIFFRRSRMGAFSVWGQKYWLNFEEIARRKPFYYKRLYDCSPMGHTVWGGKNTYSGCQFRAISQTRPTVGTGFQAFTLFSRQFLQKNVAPNGKCSLHELVGKMDKKSSSYCWLFGQIPTNSLTSCLYGWLCRFWKYKRYFIEHFKNLVGVAHRSVKNWRDTPINVALLVPKNKCTTILGTVHKLNLYIDAPWLENCVLRIEMPKLFANSSLALTSQ